jgi:hypothetical protein
MLAQSVLPAMVVFPLAAVVIVILATHLTLLRRAEMPASRKRIRTVNGVLMMLLTPFAAYAFGVAHASQTKQFVLIFFLVTGLLFIIIMLAVMDALNNVRIHRREARDLRDKYNAIKRAAERGAVDPSKSSSN